MKAGYVLTLLTVALLSAPCRAQVPPDVESLSNEWARIKYDTPEADRKASFERLAETSAALTAAHPGRVEYLVWEGIIVASAAAEQGGIGLSALAMVKRAKELLEQAERLDPDALDGSVYTSLGSLYYQVPGWPIGFGDDEKAKGYLEKALALNPDGIDSNYFYGDFLMHQRDYAAAVEVLNHALEAPPRPNRALADAGRRGEILALIEEAGRRTE